MSNYGTGDTVYCETPQGIERVLVGRSNAIKVPSHAYASYDFDGRPVGPRLEMFAWFDMPADSRQVVAYGAGPTDAIARLDRLLSPG